MPRNRVSAVLGSSVPRPRPQPFPSRSRSTLRRRAVVGVLVLLSLVLITISFRAGSGGAVHRVEGAGATVLRPFEVAAERVARPFRDGYGYFASLVHVKRENSRLKQQVNDLRQKELLGQSALEQNRVLRSQLKFIDSPRFPVDYTPVNTRIISWASEFVQQVVIAAGSDSGIKQDTPIVTNYGLVGRVTDVTGSAAQVTLLTDENSAVPALDQTTSANGLVRHGQGQGSLVLDFVRKEANVKEGDVIVTAGTQSKQYPSLFPGGIPIGVVTHVGQSDTALYKQIQIDPYVDFSALDAVTALITNKRTPKGP
ncbi:MAG: rod shape-determining protein MreC [Actinobacteria bacterium]|nr:MAG: rod shape-determining protein MreC [Actinomycetota bacterium]TML86428.1 MAG: rod shape-determining protein MreC [Actinomycetota bacterium]